MRKLLSLLSAALLCLSLAAPAQASTFVPSISYKDGPEIEVGVIIRPDADKEKPPKEEKVTGCLIVTSIIDAREKTTDIHQEERDQLLWIYGELSDGTMKLPLENDKYVTRDLVDVSWRVIGCRENHDHEEWLRQPGNTVSGRFYLNVTSTTIVVVMTYINGEWIEAEQVINNGDGTITVVFEDIGPTVFCVKTDTQGGSPETGDVMSQSLLLWIAVMAVSFCAIVVLLVLRRKKSHR